MGMLADRVRRTYLLAGAMAMWTVCMALNALAGDLPAAVRFRMGIGAVEANGPAAVSLLADYYPAQERARRMGLYQAGALVGGLVGLAGGGLAVQARRVAMGVRDVDPVRHRCHRLDAPRPEPRRGDQDADLGEDMLGGHRHHPRPQRRPRSSGCCPHRLAQATGVDLARLRPRQLVHELLRIREHVVRRARADHLASCCSSRCRPGASSTSRRCTALEEAAAGGVAALLGAGSAFGILGGGFIADRLLRRGIINSRVYVVAAGSIGASLVLMPAFASTNLTLTAPLLFVGGALLTLPVAPAEALVSDVVVPQLRGRASSVRSIVRAVSGFGPLLVGLLSDAIGLRARWWRSARSTRSAAWSCSARRGTTPPISPTSLPRARAPARPSARGDAGVP